MIEKNNIPVFSLPHQNAKANHPIAFLPILISLAIFDYAFGTGPRIEHKINKNVAVCDGTPVENGERVGPSESTLELGREVGGRPTSTYRHSMPHMSASSSTRVCPDSSPCSPRFRVNVHQHRRFTGYRLFSVV